MFQNAKLIFEGFFTGVCLYYVRSNFHCTNVAFKVPLPSKECALALVVQ